jgi:DNA adenine methylase
VTAAAPKITRPALRYYGGKWLIAPWVISNFPDHHTYVEPFGGGGSVLLQREPAPFEVLNDVDSNVINYFRVLRSRPLELKRAIDFTPFSREEVYASSELSGDPLEDARRFHIRSWQTQHGAPHMKANGWRFGRRGGNDKRSAVDDWNDTTRLPAIAERLKNVQIEHDDALKVIERFDTDRTLFYCDPPYLMSVRSDRWARNGYRIEMDDLQHEQLAAALARIKGMAIVSGYPSAKYDRLYAGWTKRMKKGRSLRNGGSFERVEVLWISPAAASRLNQREMFGHRAGGG